jgi:hypothetical protein
MPMKKKQMASIELSENHRRSISITPQLVDQALCEWDDWSSGRVQSGITFRQLDTLFPVKRMNFKRK